ncbi:hypothetical protein WG66_014473 [Moniliophthora roreri]|uniref:Uncharacterized protein n=1 Tax=Moniliophthora roreri TaxID=221103 RepID=A0A0W0FIG8_MONRR|nr:hypothetical protein WG66_014473 [Moniliophthora roreri]
MPGLRSTRRVQFLALFAVCILVIIYLTISSSSYSGPQAIFDVVQKGLGIDGVNDGIVDVYNDTLDGFSGTVEPERRPPEPPTWERLRKWEDELPQHNLELDFPEGKTGRFVRFSNQVKRLGWNNALNEVLMNAHLAYVSERAYVFQDYYWKEDYYSWPEWQFRSTPPVTPLNALIAGPAAGGPFEPNDPAPRAVSERFFDKVCPTSERRIIQAVDVKAAVWDKPGIDVLNHWAKILKEEPARCVEIVQPEEPGVDDFPQVFDLWLWGTARVLSLWKPFTESPISRLLDTSPVVKSAIDANEYLFFPRGPRLPVSGGSGSAKGSTWPRDPFSRVMALHIRRGDFREACERLANYNSTFYSWNLLPELMDPFNAPPELKWNSSEYEQYHLERCYPEADAIVQKVRDVRNTYIRSLPSGSSAVLDAMYLLTNAKGDWLADMKKKLTDDGWYTIVTSKDLELNAEQTDVNMAIDMDLARRAAVFIGNGWSSFTSNIVHRRFVDGKTPASTRFW